MRMTQLGKRDRSRDSCWLKCSSFVLLRVVVLELFEPMPTIPSADAYIFDIDGTLLVTKDLVHWNALHQAMLEAYGVDTTIEGIQYHGKTDLSILRAALGREGVSDAQFERALPKALEVVCREVEINHRRLAPLVCPGIVQLLEQLKSE